MIKTISELFQEFMKRFEPTNLQIEKISNHHTYIRKVIKKKYVIIDDFLTGSYIKKTQIKPPSDLDLFIVIDAYSLSPSYHDNPRKLLLLFMQTLKKTYPSSTLKADGQAIVVKFADGINMDVVPALKRISGNYIIPNLKTNSWIKTNPKAYNKLLSDLNKELNARLIPLIKIIKFWNQKWNGRLKSLHIEILAINCFYDKSIDVIFPFQSYQEGLLIFFKKATDLINKSTYEPIIGDKVDQYLSIGERKRLSYMFNNLQNKVNKAIKYENIGDHLKAYRLWKIIFKNCFP